MPTAVSGAAVLRAVRERMREAAVAALIVPSADAHNSEYVATHLQCRAFVSNFRGSAGTALITLDRALLWTDGRYWLAAEEEKYPEFDLMRQGKPEVLSMEEWITVNLGTKAAVGMSPYVATVAEWEQLSKNVNLRPVASIVQDMMPPEKGIHKMYLRPAEFCGATCQDRRASILAEVEKKNCDLIVLSALDEIAWLTNLRGGDVEYNPVFYAYAVIDKHHEKVRLYVNLSKVTDAVRHACGDHIDFCPYEQLEEDLKKLAQGRKALVDERQTSEAVFRMLKDAGSETVRVVCGPAQKLKGIKNEVELKGFRDCHVRDGAALTRYLAWLHDQVINKGVTDLNEYEVAVKLEELRAQEEHFVQLSFSSISSIGPNGAMCHYSPAKTGSATIRRDQLYLIDSGAQYWDGTTDVTRTICFTAPSDEQREAYTLVLKGHIALNSVVFPKGTSGVRLDILARMALWSAGLDYAHGTGHGVGSFLNVHEGPHGIGKRPVATEANMELHSVVSNEPGYYKDGHYGIRIENLEEVVECPTKYSATGFYTMSHLTMAPLCRDLINVSLLTETERAWVDRYHAKVAANILPCLQKAGDQIAVAYLKYHTQPL
ncbi:hypothetical protein LSCM1_05463 [Leishmania martiniquensis]|uniref:Aminopeptidase P1 n=1 Tax=Leishmania martiniquensis TaxID=1580590 RepID=A0A836GL42_9TRYP|nr:hypothetical protein LSCM1_05463 [Leishmania martiniquensis]